MKNNIYKTMTRLTGVLLLTFLLFATPANAQFITNGDLEAWTGSCPTNTAPNGWTNYSVQLGPDQSGSCAGTVTSHSGTSHMNLVWIGAGVLEGASQTITGLQLGSIYRVSFWAINNQGLYADPGDCILEIHQNTIPIYATPNLVSGGAWTYYYVDFTAQAPTEPIGIRVKGGTSGTSGSAGVDDFAVTELVGVRDGMIHSLNVYPIPAQDALYIHQGDVLNGDLNQVPYAVRNVLGQQVLESEVNFTAGKAKLDLPALQPGVYYLELTINGERMLRKFVME